MTDAECRAKHDDDSCDNCGKELGRENLNETHLPLVGENYLCDDCEQHYAHDLMHGL